MKAEETTIQIKYNTIQKKEKNTIQYWEIIRHVELYLSRLGCQNLRFLTTFVRRGKRDRRGLGVRRSQPSRETRRARAKARFELAKAPAERQRKQGWTRSYLGYKKALAAWRGIIESVAFLV